MGKQWLKETEAAGHISFKVKEDENCQLTVCFLVWSRTPAQEMVPSTFRIDLPCPVQPFWKDPPRHTPGCVSKLILNLKLTTKVKHSRDQPSKNHSTYSSLLWLRRSQWSLIHLLGRTLREEGGARPRSVKGRSRPWLVCYWWSAWLAYFKVGLHI